ncbi:MAG: TonB-dependent receptor [Gammaproteobacteria bacterium]
MKRKWLKSVVISGVALSQQPLFAAEEPALDEVLVTAQKREERTIDVPMSLTVVGAKDMEERGVRSIQDISLMVPGVAMRQDGPGSLEVFMRGVGNLAGAEAIASVYMDETPTTLYLFRQLDLRSLDMERVEVLKGPQGTLYGQGAAAGTIRFITHKPVLNEFTGRVEGELSSIDHGDTNEKVTGIVNIPLVTDKLAVRVAASGEWGGGWIDQPQAGLKDANNQDLHNIRARMLWKPTDALEIDATAVTYRMTSELGLDYEGPDHTTAIGIDRSRRIRPRLDKYELYNLTGSYNFGSATLTSATSYIDYYREYTLPYISPAESLFTPVGGNLEGISTYNDFNNQFTQEIRLTSNGDGRVHYTLGGFYRDVEGNFGGPIDTLYNGSESRYDYVSNNASESWSVFADGGIKLGDRWDVGAGVRSFHDDSSIFDGAITQSATFKSTDPRVYASFALNDNAKLYANVAKGFRSGGFNGNGQPAYDPEKLINYEIGAKGVLPDARLSFDASVFYTDYKDMIRRGLLIVGGIFENIAANIGTVHIKGVEVGMGWRATDQLSLSASGAYYDTEIVKLNAGSSPNEVGDESDYVPKVSYTLAGDYSFPLSGNANGFVHVDLNHRDPVKYTDRFMYYPGFTTQESESFSLLGARIGARWGQTSVELFGNNLTNQNKSMDPFTLWQQANRTKPRTIGIKGAYSF